MPLPRVLRFWDLTLLIIGTVIGSGIFLVPASVLRNAHGRVGLAFGVWIAGGILSLLGALSYGELSARVPEAGGLYIYIRDGFGPLPAFLYGWTLFFLISSGSVATLAVAFSMYLGGVVPLSPLLGKLVAIGMIAVLATVNVLGTRRGANLQNYATAIKVIGVLGMAVALLCFAHPHPQAATSSAPASTTDLLKGFGLAMISVLWAYEGWQYCTFSAGETLNPHQTFPRALAVGTLALVAIYVLVNVGYIHALGVARAEASESIAAAAIATVFGSKAASAVSLAILISMFGAANGLTLTSPRVYYAMAKDRLFFRKLAEVHPRFQTPAFAIVASSIWAALLAASGTFEQLLTYVVFSSWMFYALGAAALFIYRKGNPEQKLAYEVPGYPWTPAIFILAAIALVLNTAWAQPLRALIGFLLIASGLPAFFLWRRRARSELPVPEEAMTTTGHKALTAAGRNSVVMATGATNPGCSREAEGESPAQE